MHWWFRGFLDRLAFRLMSVLSAKVEAELELELAEVRANLLMRANEYGAQSDELTAVAQTLTESSARLGQSDYLPAAHEQVALARLEQAQRERSSESKPSPGMVAPKKPVAAKSAATSKRGRGRPPKAGGPSAIVRKEREVTATDTPAGGPTDGL
ncbi:MAG: hypothetical protein SH850_16010 [Planctomycetaceae bacterium]|nr:hypothetical protein [Planctomycetaceae bacterium]